MENSKSVEEKRETQNSTADNSENKNTNAQDDEYEECTFAVELHGLFDESAIREAVEEGKCKVCQLDSDEPLLQIGTQLFAGKWEEVFGTDMIFREIPHRHLLSYEGCTEKRMLAQRVILIPKNKTQTNEKNKEVDADVNMENENIAEETLHGASGSLSLEEIKE